MRFPIFLFSKFSELRKKWSSKSCVYFGDSNELFKPLICGNAQSTTTRMESTFFNKILLLLLSRFSRVKLCATPQTAAHQAPLSLGFFQQEHWSGLPFPSLVHEREKWKWSLSVVSDSSRSQGLQPTRLLRPWDFPGKSTGHCHYLLLSPS